MKKSRLIVIAGPTASGKTAVAIELAKRLHTEIVSADSRQVYEELNVGTAKPSAAELAVAAHHFISVRSVREEYNAGQFGRDALALIEEFFGKHEYVILCGGSGLYIKAVCEGFDDLPEVTPGIREELISNYSQKGIGWLQENLEAIDPEYYASVDQQNPQRLMRALELNYASGHNVAGLRTKPVVERSFEIVKIGLDVARAELYMRIDRRVDEMIANGLFEEAAALYELRELNALQTVGYREIFGHLDGAYDRAEAVRLLKRNTRRYAKRQLTWFKRDPRITWFRPGDHDRILSHVTRPA